MAFLQKMKKVARKGGNIAWIVLEDQYDQNRCANQAKTFIFDHILDDIMRRDGVCDDHLCQRSLIIKIILFLLIDHFITLDRLKSYSLQSMIATITLEKPSRPRGNCSPVLKDFIT